MSSVGNKRAIRSASSDALARLENGLPTGKRQETQKQHPAVEHLLPPAPSESKAAYFRRLGARLRRDIFSPAATFDRDGLYIYKRPVRSGSGDNAALLAAGGSVFHHVVVYVKAGDELTALEFCPANNMDITDNMMVEVASAPVLLRPAPEPEPACLPMLHIAAPHHPLGAQHVQKALAFAESQPYHALQSNCICFADFAVRVLTGGAVKCAPLLFDLLVGQVPPVDSPLLTLLTLTTGLRWHEACDGGRMLQSFLEQRPAALPPPPAAAPQQQPSLLLPEAAVPAALAEPAVPAAVQPAGAAPALAGWLPPAPAQQVAQQPAGSSSSSEDTRGVEVEEASGLGASSAFASSASANVAARFLEPA